MNNSYLRIVNDGVDDIVFDDVSYPAPSQITPSLEMIKNTERSLGGKMHVDIVATKKRLQIVFDMLEDSDLQKALSAFGVGNDEPSEEGLKIWYFDLPIVQGVRQTKKFFVYDVTFDPLVGESDQMTNRSNIKWRDVTIELVEI